MTAPHTIHGKSPADRPAIHSHKLADGYDDVQDESLHMVAAVTS